MAESIISLQLDTSKLEAFGRQLEREIKRYGSGRGPLHRAVEAAGAVYMGWTRERFHLYSRGGGDWAPLAESTKTGRRGDGEVASILRDTSVLFNSVSQWTSEDIPGGVRVGTDVEYARYHQEGGRNLPKREIFVEPPESISRRMLEVLTDGLQRSIDELGGSRS